MRETGRRCLAQKEHFIHASLRFGLQSILGCVDSPNTISSSDRRCSPWHDAWGLRLACVGLEMRPRRDRVMTTRHVLVLEALKSAISAFQSLVRGKMFLRDSRSTHPSQPHVHFQRVAGKSCPRRWVTVERTKLKNLCFPGSPRPVPC